MHVAQLQGDQEVRHPKPSRPPLVVSLPLDLLGWVMYPR